MNVNQLAMLGAIMSLGMPMRPDYEPVDDSRLASSARSDRKIELPKRKPRRGKRK